MPRIADDVGLPNVVEKRCLAVVDVTHDGDNRMPRFEVFRTIFFLDDLFDFLFFHLLDFEVELISDNGDCIPVEALVQRDHKAEFQARRDDLVCLYPHKVG